MARCDRYGTRADHWGAGGRFYLDEIELPRFDHADRLYLSPDAAAFRKREASPGGGQRRFVQGNYEGKLAPTGGRLELRDRDGRLVAAAEYGEGTAVSERRGCHAM